jgi:hypothetical protein
MNDRFKRRSYMEVFAIDIMTVCYKHELLQRSSESNVTLKLANKEGDNGEGSATVFALASSITIQFRWESVFYN